MEWDEMEKKIINKLSNGSITPEDLKDLGITIKIVLDIVEQKTLIDTKHRLKTLRSEFIELRKDFLEEMDAYYLEEFNKFTDSPKLKLLCEALTNYSGENCWATVTYDKGSEDDFNAHEIHSHFFTAKDAPGAECHRDNIHFKLMSKPPVGSIKIPMKNLCYSDKASIEIFNSDKYLLKSRSLYSEIVELESALRHPSALVRNERNKFIKKYLSNTDTGAMLLELFDN